VTRWASWFFCPRIQWCWLYLARIALRFRQGLYDLLSIMIPLISHDFRPFRCKVPLLNYIFSLTIDKNRIALMVKNASTNPLCKTNLIIAPTALLDQWKLEIEMKTNHGMTCLIYHGTICRISQKYILTFVAGPSKPRKRKELLKYDVVLTTYAVRFPAYMPYKLTEAVLLCRLWRSNGQIWRLRKKPRRNARRLTSSTS
jgi:hypothetical protein